MPRKAAKAPGGAPSTQEAYETKLIALAMAQAEQQLAEGTAPVPVVTHFLKLGSQRAELELEKIKAENEVLAAKTAALNSQSRSEELYEAALAAFTSYRSSELDD